MLKFIRSWSNNNSLTFAYLITKLTWILLLMHPFLGLPLEDPSNQFNVIYHYFLRFQWIFIISIFVTYHNNQVTIIHIYLLNIWVLQRLGMLASSLELLQKDPHSTNSRWLLIIKCHYTTSTVNLCTFNLKLLTRMSFSVFCILKFSIRSKMKRPICIGRIGDHYRSFIGTVDSLVGANIMRVPFVTCKR